MLLIPLLYDVTRLCTVSNVQYQTRIGQICLVVRVGESLPLDITGTQDTKYTFGKLLPLHGQSIDYIDNSRSYV